LIRDLFIDTLNDCGCFGPEDAETDLYTGEVWG
jgi:hypothetical protein